MPGARRYRDSVLRGRSLKGEEILMFAVCRGSRASKVRAVLDAASVAE
jgi:hypothetical protein